MTEERKMELDHEKATQIARRLRELDLDPHPDYEVNAYEKCVLGRAYLDLKAKHAVATEPEDGDLYQVARDALSESIGGRPDFAGFLSDLRDEKRWNASLHRDDKTGQSRTDQKNLAALAEAIEHAGKRLGFL